MGWCSPSISWTNALELNLPHTCTCIFSDHIRFHSLTDFSCGAPGCSKEPPPVLRPILQQQTCHRNWYPPRGSVLCVRTFTDMYDTRVFWVCCSLFRAGPGDKASSTMAEKYDFLFKLLLIGEDAVGKTSMLIRYTKDTFCTPFSTIGELSCLIHCANLSVVLVN